MTNKSTSSINFEKMNSCWCIFSDPFIEWNFQHFLVKDMTSLKGFNIDESLVNCVKLIKAAVEESEWKGYSGLWITVINGNIKVIKTLYPMYAPIQIGTYKIIIGGKVKNR